MTSKDIEPRSLDEQDMFSKGAVTTNISDEGGIEDVNSRAEEGVSDRRPLPESSSGYAQCA